MHRAIFRTRSLNTSRMKSSAQGCQLQGNFQCFFLAVSHERLFSGRMDTNSGERDKPHSSQPFKIVRLSAWSNFLYLISSLLLTYFCEKWVFFSFHKCFKISVHFSYINWARELLFSEMRLTENESLKFEIREVTSVENTVRTMRSLVSRGEFNLRTV